MSKKRELVLGITRPMILPALWAASVSLGVAGPAAKPCSASVTENHGVTATPHSN
jgi:hypothetical protein